MWLYSFCDILYYVFTQIFIIDIQKIMIIQQTLFIVILAVGIAFSIQGLYCLLKRNLS